MDSNLLGNRSSVFCPPPVPVWRTLCPDPDVCYSRCFWLKAEDSFPVHLEGGRQSIRIVVEVTRQISESAKGVGDKE